MHLAEVQQGQFRVYAAALGVPDGIGFHAGVVVRRFPLPAKEGAEAFRDERLDDGRTWANPEEALAFALEVGRAAVQAQAILAAAKGCRLFSSRSRRIS